jgi:hypothetical protein
LADLHDRLPNAGHIAYASLGFDNSRDGEVAPASP